jgi:hypothetical protein
VQGHTGIVSRILAALAVVLVGLAFAQDSVKATGRGHTLTLNADGVRRTYTLSEKRVGVDMDQARVLEFQHKNGLSYVLLDISGPSNRAGGSHQCGAGQESSLVWLHLKRWHLLEFRAVRYSSCWFSIDYAKAERHGTFYTISFSDFSAMKDKTVTYDRAHPELGLTLTGRPMQQPK